MRPALLWAAAVTVVATVVVSWLPDEQPLSAPAHARSHNTAQSPATRQTSDGPKVTSPGSSVGPLSAPISAPIFAPPAALLSREPWPRIEAAEQAAWTPPAPPAPPARPVRPTPASAALETPPPPPPPAFTYQWLGQLVEDGQTRLFLAGPQRTEVHAIGDVMPTGWRIDGVQDGQLQLTWMATGATVSLAARP